MCDGPDSGLITQTRQQTPEHCLKVGAFASGSSMSGLIEHSAHVFVAFRRTAAGVLFGAFFLQLTRDRVRIQSQIECLLEEMRIKLSIVVSDLLGSSGLRILHALANGETDPAKYLAKQLRKFGYNVQISPANGAPA